MLGIAAILFYFIHGGFWIWKGAPDNLLWICHLGSFSIGAGLLVRRSRPIGVGVVWLGLGNFMWALFLLGGGEFEFTSLLTHVGGLIIGIIGAFQLGMPRFSWLWGLAGLGAVQQLCRWVTSAKENVNLAFRVHEGWETIFPSYAVYFVVLFFFSGVYFWAVESLVRGLIRKYDGPGRALS